MSGHRCCEPASGIFETFFCQIPQSPSQSPCNFHIYQSIPGPVSGVIALPAQAQAQPDRPTDHPVSCQSRVIALPAQPRPRPRPWSCQSRVIALPTRPRPWSCRKLHPVHHRAIIRGHCLHAQGLGVGLKAEVAIALLWMESRTIHLRSSSLYACSPGSQLSREALVAPTLRSL